MLSIPGGVDCVQVPKKNISEVRPSHLPGFVLRF